MSKAEDQRHAGVTCWGGKKKALLKVIHLPGLVWAWTDKQQEQTRQLVEAKQHLENLVEEASREENKGGDV